MSASVHDRPEEAGRFDDPIAAASDTPRARILSPVHNLWGQLRDVFQGEGEAFDQSRRLLSRSIVLHELPAPGASRRVVSLIVVLVIGFVIWASFLRLDELAVAPGEIAPAEFVQPIQHLEGGIVQSILVGDGESVKAGQILVQLDKTASQADQEGALALRNSLTQRARRLEAFAQGKILPVESVERVDPALVSQSSLRQSQIHIADAQRSQRSSQVAGLLGRQKAVKEQIASLEKDIALRRPLVEKGYVSLVTFLALDRELSRLRGELVSTTADIAAARSAVIEAGGRRSEVEERLRTEALVELSAVNGQLAELNERLRRFDDRVARLAIRAPMAGIVTGLSVHALGEVIAPGALVAQIVPQDGRLVADVKISPRDIGFVKVGLPVTVKVQTFDFTRYGGLKGTVESVSATSFVDSQGHTFFRARIRLEPGNVGLRQKALTVSPGMTVSADIKTGSKSLLAYLFKPVSNALGTAFSER